MEDNHQTLNWKFYDKNYQHSFSSLIEAIISIVNEWKRSSPYHVRIQFTNWRLKDFYVCFGSGQKNVTSGKGLIVPKERFQCAPMDLIVNSIILGHPRDRQVTILLLKLVTALPWVWEYNQGYRCFHVKLPFDQNNCTCSSYIVIRGLCCKNTLLVPVSICSNGGDSGISDDRNV